MSLKIRPAVSLGILRIGFVCAAALFALSVLALGYVSAGATIRPDDTHTHRQVHKSVVTYLTDEQELINFVASYSALGSFVGIAMFGFSRSRIKDREQQRALQEQSLRDDRDPRNIN
jgi:hypothetical protein